MRFMIAFNSSRKMYIIRKRKFIFDEVKIPYYKLLKSRLIYYTKLQWSNCLFELIFKKIPDNEVQWFYLHDNSCPHWLCEETLIDMGCEVDGTDIIQIYNFLIITFFEVTAIQWKMLFSTFMINLVFSFINLFYQIIFSFILFLKNRWLLYRLQWNLLLDSNKFNRLYTYTLRVFTNWKTATENKKKTVYSGLVPPRNIYQSRIQAELIWTECNIFQENEQCYFGRQVQHHI